MTENAQKTYYSRAANLIIQVNPGAVTELADGRKARVGFKIVEFKPVTSTAGTTSGGGWGVYHTSDPEIIKFLDTRIASHKADGSPPDVLHDTEWAEAIVPADKKVQMFKGQVGQLQRELEEKNKLLEILKQQEGARQARKRVSRAKAIAEPA